ncbi:helix-turn-helix transcriptional regulator [Streptomyces sp. NPDC046925]|uniref:helix-turn-helix transcriptional regulator n=1 Tax=Streptomyces sp. NPDC046925 TaxID=3155375 RepID=UPI0033CC8ABC
MSHVFEVTDLDAALALIREQYSSVQLKLHTERPLLRIRQDPLGQARLDRVTFRMHYDFTGDPLGLVFVGHLLRGRSWFRSSRDEVHVQQGDVFLLSQPDASLQGRVDSAVIDFAVVEPSLLGDIAQNAPGVRGPVRLLGRRPFSPLAGAQWSHTVGLVRELVTSPLTLKSPLITAQAERLLAAATLAAFPNTTLTDPTIQDRRDAHPATMSRALAYIEEHPREDLTVIEIARAARVSVRALQLAFRRHLDTTPMRYLREVRLQHAHGELRDAVPGQGVTVTSVAARWGFSTPSRFSTLYRQTFGFPPAQTLRGERRLIPLSGQALN